MWKELCEPKPQIIKVCRKLREGCLCRRVRESRACSERGQLLVSLSLANAQPTRYCRVAQRGLIHQSRRCGIGVSMWNRSVDVESQRRRCNDRIIDEAYQRGRVDEVPEAEVVVNYFSIAITFPEVTSCTNHSATIIRPVVLSRVLESTGFLTTFYSSITAKGDSIRLLCTPCTPFSNLWWLHRLVDSFPHDWLFHLRCISS